MQLEELLNAYGATPCKLASPVEDDQDATLQAEEAAEPKLSGQHIDLNDVTHIITMKMDFRDHKAVEARNARVTEAAEASGKTSTAAPGATGRRGDLIAVVTVS